MSPISFALTFALTLGLALPAAASGPASDDETMPLGRTVFQVLVGELALQRGYIPLGVDAWADLAVRSRDPAALARATEVASMSGQHERALMLSRLWLEVDPEAVRALEMQAAMLIQTGQLAELQPQLATLLQRDRGNLSSNILQLNRLLARVPDKVAVQRVLEETLLPYLNLPETHFALAQAALATGQPEQALARFDQARRMRPAWEAASVAHAQLLSRQDASRAIRDLEHFLNRQPQARDARITLARLYVREKRFSEARRHYTRLLRNDPDDPEILYPVAILALQDGDADFGRRQLERLLTTAYPDKSTVHFFLGQLALEGRRPDDALVHLRQVHAGERYLPARLLLAQTLQQQGRNDEALLALRDTRALTAAESVTLAQTEARLLRSADRLQEALERLQTALASQPDDSTLLYDAALIADQLQQYELMEALLRRILAAQPTHAHALNALGYSLAERAIRLDEAETLLRQALALAPEDPYITDSVGWLQYRRGQLADAAVTLQNAYRLKADPEIAAHLGEVLWQLGRQGEAVRIWREAQRRHPDNRPLRDTLQQFLP